MAEVLHSDAAVVAARCSTVTRPRVASPMLRRLAGQTCCQPGTKRWLPLLARDRPGVETSNPLVACSHGGAIDGAVCTDPERCQPPTTPGRCCCATSIEHAMAAWAIHADAKPPWAPGI